MTTSAIQIKPGTRGTDKQPCILLLSPFHPSFPVKAKALGGKWSSEKGWWIFDPRDTDRVRQLCVDIYGIDPLAEAPAETVTVRLTKAAIGDYSDDVWFAGRQVLRYGKPCDGCAIIAGTVLHGGSRKHPNSRPSDDFVLEVRDLPRGLVNQEVRNRTQVVEKALAAERERLALYDTDISKATGYVAGHADRLPPEQRAEFDRRALESRKHQEQRVADAEAAAAVTAITIVETPDPAEAIREIRQHQIDHQPEPAPGAPSPLEALWQQIAALPEAEQVEIRNRLLQTL